MSTDRSERQIAQELIAEYGDDAALVAARRAEAARRAGGDEFARAKRVMMAVLDLRAAGKEKRDPR